MTDCPDPRHRGAEGRRRRPGDRVVPGPRARGRRRRCRFELIAGGRSNLTYRVTDAAGHAWVLRRPPLGQVLATAHDMGREHRIISALAPTDVPVAPVVGLCDRRVGQRRAVLRHGLRRRPRGPRRGEPPRRSTSRPAPAPATRSPTCWPASTPSTPTPSGSATSGRREGYIERQLKRWYGQWEKSKTRELPGRRRGARRAGGPGPRAGPGRDRPRRLPPRQLPARRPTARSPRSSTGSCARSATRWPTSACCSCTGPSRGDAHPALLDAATTLDGLPVPGRAASSATPPPRAATCRDVDYYVAFGYWKLACILEGVYARYRGGVMGESSGFEGFARQVEILADAARSTVASLPPA